jgi:plastocyanin
MLPMRRAKTGWLCLLLLLAATAAHAEDHLIIQKNKAFEQNGVAIEDLKVRAGDTLTFTNNDVVTHNIFSKDGANQFEIPKQEPGITATVTMKAPGDVNIRCAIHPKMKLHVIVLPKGAAN